MIWRGEKVFACGMDDEISLPFPTKGRKRSPQPTRMNKELWKKEMDGERWRREERGKRKIAC
jgi:hypothetical protein